MSPAVGSRRVGADKYKRCVVSRADGKNAAAMADTSGALGPDVRGVRGGECLRERSDAAVDVMTNMHAWTASVGSSFVFLSPRCPTERAVPWSPAAMSPLASSCGRCWTDPGSDGARSTRCTRRLP